MNVEIINVGTELLLGEVVNTNATYLQKVCKELGFNVYYQTVVGDNPERLYESLRLAFDKGADCVITTGGLGPTQDDLTKEVSAQYFGLELLYNQEEADKVEKKCRFCMRQDDIPKSNFKQAYYPEKVHILENKMGTANGCIMFQDHKMIVNLPGPPKEMMNCVEQSLRPYFDAKPAEKIYTFEYTTMLIGESKIEDILHDLIQHQDKVSIALYAGEETVRIRLATKTSSQSQANELMKPIQSVIEKRLSESLVWERDIKAALVQKKPSLAIDYRNDFRFQDDFLKPLLSKTPQVSIVVECQKEELGEVIVIHFNDDFVYEIPVFVSATYAYERIEARFVAQLYRYICKHHYEH